MVSGRAARFCASAGAARHTSANTETSARLRVIKTSRYAVEADLRSAPTIDLPGRVGHAWPIRLAEVVAHIGDRERPVLLRGDLEVVRLAVVHRRRRRLLPLRRRRPGGDGKGSVR